MLGLFIFSTPVPELTLFLQEKWVVKPSVVFLSITEVRALEPCLQRGVQVRHQWRTFRGYLFLTWAQDQMNLQMHKTLLDTMCSCISTEEETRQNLPREGEMCRYSWESLPLSQAIPELRRHSISGREKLASSNKMPKDSFVLYSFLNWAMMEIYIYILVGRFPYMCLMFRRKEFF